MWTVCVCVYVSLGELGTCGVYKSSHPALFFCLFWGFFSLQEESTDTQLGEVSSQAVRAFPDLE